MKNKLIRLSVRYRALFALLLVTIAGIHPKRWG